METNAQVLQDRAREVSARVAPQIDQARETLSDLDTRVRAFVRERPGTAVLCALGIGYVFGKLVAR